MCGTCSILGRDITIVLYRFENLKGLGHTRDPSVSWTIILKLPLLYVEVLKAEHSSIYVRVFPLVTPRTLPADVSTIQ
jgi:hypothetical protein